MSKLFVLSVSQDVTTIHTYTFEDMSQPFILLNRLSWMLALTMSKLLVLLPEDVATIHTFEDMSQQFILLQRVS